MPISDFHDFGSSVVGFAQGVASAVAGGAGDNTEVVGQWVDTLGIPGVAGSLGVAGVRFGSCALFFPFSATLAASETLVLKTVKLETCAPDESGDPDAATAVELDSASSIATVTVAIATGVGVHKVARSFAPSACKQFVRVKWTPDLSRAVTDTAVVSCLMVVGGTTNPLTPKTI